MTQEPTTPTGPRTLTVAGPRRAQLAVAVAAGLAVAFVPASQALASGHKPTPKPPASAASRAGDGERGHGDRREGKGTKKAQPCGTVNEKAWWPFGNALHGSTVMETKDGGIQPSYFQRGIVQSVSDTQVTVLSKDDYLGTWTLTDATAVWRFGHRGAAPDLAAGQCVGVWGSAGTATAPTARFVVIKWLPKTPPRPNASPTVSPSASPSVSPSASPSVSVTPTESPSSSGGAGAS